MALDLKDCRGPAVLQIARVLRGPTVLRGLARDLKDCRANRCRGPGQNRPCCVWGCTWGYSKLRTRTTLGFGRARRRSIGPAVGRCLSLFASKGAHPCTGGQPDAGVNLISAFRSTLMYRGTRKVDIRLPGKGDSNSHGARPVHPKHRWIRSSRLSIKDSLSVQGLLEINDTHRP